MVVGLPPKVYIYTGMYCSNACRLRAQKSRCRSIFRLLKLCFLFISLYNNNANIMRCGSMLKRQILLVFLSAILMLACKKDKDSDSDGDEYYIKFKLDGTELQFKGMPYATFSVADDIYLGGFGASKEQGVTENMMSVLVGSLESIRAGVTYTGLIYPPVTGGSTPAVLDLHQQYFLLTLMPKASLLQTCMRIML